MDDCAGQNLADRLLDEHWSAVTAVAEGLCRDGISASRWRHHPADRRVHRAQRRRYRSSGPVSWRPAVTGKEETTRCRSRPAGSNPFARVACLSAFLVLSARTPIRQNTGVVPIRPGGRDRVRARPALHARLTPDGITQRCVLDHNHEGPHLDQSVQRVWWAADSDVGQTAGEPPVADREPTDDVELVDPATERRRYYAKVPAIVEEYQRAARLNQSWNDRLQRLVIAFSAVTTALAGVAVAVADWRVRIAPIVTSAVAAIAAGLTAYHKYRGQSLSQQRAADEIEHELEVCTLGIGDYAGKDEEQRLGLLAQRVVAAQEPERKRCAGAGAATSEAR
jgi:hypothetical protein